MNEKLTEDNANGQINSSTSRYSGKTYASFSMYQITWTVIMATFGMTYYRFYHTVVGLEPIHIFLVMVIFSIWDAINEPLIGFLVDRNFKWTRKWGRRFPWIVVSIIPWCISLYLIYIPPTITPDNPWPAFFWLLFALLIFDTLITLLDVNVGALRADKFRTDEERTKYSKVFGPVDMIAQVIGMALPPIFLSLGEGRTGYAIMGAIMVSIGLISAILFLPGAKEDKIIIDRYYSNEYEQMTFFESIKEVITQKSFIAFFISYSTFGVATTILTSMLLYVTEYLLNVEEDMGTIFMAIFLSAAMISVIFWQKYMKKIQNKKKVYTIGGITLCLSLIPMTFFPNIESLFIIFFIIGLSIGCIWTFGVPVILSDVQDDFVVRTGKNQKGMLLGTWALISRFTGFIDELLFLIVFTLVSFPTGVDTYEKLINVPGIDVGLVQFGIRLLIGVIPACILFIGVLIFWKFYPIDNEMEKKNKAKLKELGF